MALKRGDDVNRVSSSKKYPRFVRVLIIAGIILGIIVIYYSFLLFLFSIGDYVSKKSDVTEIGKIQGLSALKLGYLVIWGDGTYSVEQFWSISTLSSVEDYETIDRINQLKNDNQSGFAEFKKEDNFNDYIISNDNSGSDSNVLMYFGIFGNLNYTVEKQCSSDFVCSSWGACYVDYTLRTLFSNESLSGVSYRYCKDNNNCFPDLVDSKECSDKLEITTRTQNWCNKDYLEILDSYGRVLARMNNNSFKNYMDVSLNIGNIGYCAYCHNGKKDFDETSKDCGGSCMSCAELKKLSAK